MYDIEFTVAAARELKKLAKKNRKAANQIRDAIRGLAEEPRPTGIEKISDGEGLFRIRTGNFRIIYEIHDEKLVVLVVRVGDRKEIYAYLKRI